MMRRQIAGDAGVDIEDESARLYLNPGPGGALALAQLDDYHPDGPARVRFHHRPPIRAALYARAWPARPRGEFGFGFHGGPESPASLWFYSSGTPGEWRARVQDGARIHESVLAGVPLTEWVHYEIEWLADAAAFRVAGTERFRVRAALTGPLGVALWMSNRPGPDPLPRESTFSPIDEAQWLEVKSLRVGV